MLGQSPEPSSPTDSHSEVSEHPEPEMSTARSRMSRYTSPTPIPTSAKFPGKFPRPPLPTEESSDMEEDEEDGDSSETEWCPDWSAGQAPSSTAASSRRSSLSDLLPVAIPGQPLKPMHAEVTRYRTTKSPQRDSLVFEYKCVSVGGPGDKPHGPYAFGLPHPPAVQQPADQAVVARWGPSVAGRTIAFVAGGVVTWLIVGAVRV